MASARLGEAGLNLDLTVPDPARMVDYWLGGGHHFEVDRAMAKNIEKMTPMAPHWVRAQRQFLRRVVTFIARELGETRFLVAGSGLPTCGNVHEAVPGATVLYTDNNPVTVAYGRNILGDNPLVRYLNHDARFLHEIDDADMSALFGDSRKLAIIYIGFSYFFPEAILKETLQNLYRWVDPGSYLAITAMGEDSIRFAAPSLEAYARMGRPIFCRNREQTLDVISPWLPTSHGVRAASHWGVEDATEPAPPVFVYGLLASKAV